MNVTPTVILGIVFLVLGIATTFTMFQYWGYPFDKENRKSECPQWKMNIHRILGLGYVIVYVIMMTHMVPRLWQYQIEFPARTVAHIILGTSIGFILIIKLSILRWFRHFEEWMPALGTSMLLCTVLITVLSVPFFFKEAAMASGAIGGTDPFSEANRSRVTGLLAGAGFEEGTPLEGLTSVASLKHGRRVLLNKCVYCHDLKTAIDKPRTPENWVRTVKRMVYKPTLGTKLSLREADLVSAYLIAITPDLQRSAKEKRKVSIEKEEAQDALSDLETETSLAGDEMPSEESSEFDEAGDTSTKEIETPAVDVEPVSKTSQTGEKSAIKKAQVTPEKQSTPKVAAVKPKPKPKKKKIDAKLAAETFKEECSLCHGIDDIDNAPPKSRAEINSMLKRMIDNGFDADKATMQLIRFHMAKTYL